MHTDDEDDNYSSNDDNVDEIETMKKAWEYLSPPNKEEDLIGKWFGVSYQGKRGEILYISKLVSRFLFDEDGPVDKLIMRSLKPKIGSGTILEDTPAHLPPDESSFNLTDVIAGPLEVNPLKGSSKFDVPKYNQVKENFSILKNKDRKNL